MSNNPTTTGPSPRDSLADSLDRAFGDEEAGRTPSSATAFLVGLSGKYAGKLFKLRTGEHILGRTSKAFIQLDEKSASHQHARLLLTSAGCTVTDLDSTNGTYVNDIKLVGSQELHAGDVLRIGTTMLGFLTDAEDEEQHTRALARVPQPSLITSSAKAFSQNNAPAAAIVQSAHGSVIPTSPASPTALDGALDKLDFAMAFVRRYWKVILISGVVMAVVGVASVKLVPPLGKAEFEIFLRDDPTKTAAQQYFASRDIEYFVAAEKNFLNLDLVRETMRDMELPTPGGAVLATSRALEFKKAGASIYQGAYSHRDPKFAEKFLAQHLKNYLEREIGKSIKVLASEVDLLRTQYEDNVALLKEQENDLRNFKEAHIDALPEVAEGQVGSRADLLLRKDELSAEVTRSSQQLALAKKQLASEDAYIDSKVTASAPYEERLAQVKQEIAAARARGLAEGHPELQQLRNEQKSLTQLRDNTLNAATTDFQRRSNLEQRRLANQVGELEVAVNAASQELGQVEARLASIQKVAGKMPEVEAELADKMRQLDASQRLHDKLHAQLKAKELELQFERASVAARYEVMQAPTAFSLNPVLSLIKRLIAGFVVGCLLGVGLAGMLWLKDYAKRRRERLSSQSISLA